MKSVCPLLVILCICIPQWQAKVEDKHATRREVPARGGLIWHMDGARGNGLLLGTDRNRTECDDNNMAGSDESGLRIMRMPGWA